MSRALSRISFGVISKHVGQKLDQVRIKSECYANGDGIFLDMRAIVSLVSHGIKLLPDVFVVQLKFSPRFEEKRVVEMVNQFVSVFDFTGSFIDGMKLCL